MTHHDSISNNIVDLLIVGAGPCGLAAAVEAQRLGLSFRIIEKKTARSSHDSRALVIHPRVLELLEPIGNGSVVEKILDASIRNPTINVHFGKNKTLSQSPNDSQWGDTDYSFAAWLPQYDTERILEERLTAGADGVDYGVSLESLDQTADQVTATLRHTCRRVETFTAKYVLGCDGGRSKTRELAGVKMNRSPSKVYFIVADVKFVGEVPFDREKELHVFPTHEDGVGVMFPLPDGYRLLFQAPKEVTDKSGLNMNKAFFEDLLLERTGLNFDVELGEWQAIFEITHGVSESFRKGRVMLAGDAAHVHSPVGGQGLNYGMQDISNLLWKLAWAKRCNGRFPSSSAGSVDMILDSYNDERHSMGADLIELVDFSTLMLTTRNPIIQKLRNIIIRMAFKVAAKHNIPKVGQLQLKYKPQASRILFTESTGSNYICNTGERLPNLRLSAGSKLHKQINRERHTWVFLNTPVPDCMTGRTNVISVQASTDQVSAPAIAQKALTKPQVILVRPDLFVAGVDATLQALSDRVGSAIDERSIATM